MSRAITIRRSLLGKPARILTALLLAVLVAPPVGAEPSKKDRQRAAADMVVHALIYEAGGNTTQRNELLKWALEKSPDYAPAMWHSGFVRFDNKWVKADDVPDLVATKKVLADYAAERARTPKTAAGEFRLANWCASHSLREQERAHLTKTLEFDNDHAAARKRLHFVMIDGVWRGDDEIRSAGAQADRAEASLKRWSGRLKYVEKLLSRADDRSLDAAADRLREMQDPSAIPAMELSLANMNEASARLLIDTLSRMPSTEATVALARQAVSSNWPNIREKAAELLKARHEDEYVPALLSAMYTPIQSKSELYASPDGRLVYTHSFFREGQDHKELAVHQTSIERVARALGNVNETRERAVRAAKQVAEVRDAMRDEANSKSSQQNDRVCEALAIVTNETVASTPQAWWKWWNDHNEIYIEGEKPIQQTYRSEEVSIVDTTPPAVALDCLAAGTQVWTATGRVAIDEMKAGDLVLSQNPETGELAYKPVLRTTVRPAGNLFKIGVGNYAIQSSGGHTFWVDGSGWVKTRKLDGGARLHAVTGSVMVDSVEKTDLVEPTYNLVVADFHSYFVCVGEDRVLSHDNTVRKAVAATPVGLPGRR